MHSVDEDAVVGPLGYDCRPGSVVGDLKELEGQTCGLLCARVPTGRASKAAGLPWRCPTDARIRIRYHMINHFDFGAPSPSTNPLLLFAIPLTTPSTGSKQ